MEEVEDTRDTDTETEEESDLTEKFFKAFLFRFRLAHCRTYILVHHTPFQFQLLETTPEQLNRPRG